MVMARINTRTTPEQGTSNYSYYQNNLLQTVTDARGATTTLLYNGRHLVTNINYTVTGSVAATPNISFGYDSAGNRTSMTDALGSVSYVYNTLSQMTSETRTFNGLAGSFGLTYTYGLAGQLKTVTNPWGAQIGYNYDKIGRLASVSGSGYAGVSSYVSSFAYRAFGPKQINYSNGRSLSLQYDSRMRPTEWSTPGVLRMQYSYTWEKSGRVEFARNLDDETLDRWFAYDSVGRLIVSRSGNEARLAIGEQVPLLYNGPYSHGYSYDKFGNITAREGWGGTNPAYSVSFNNNKMNGHTYDASGNLTDAGGGWTFTYDANSQQITSAVNGVLNVYDGERLRGKKTEGGVTFYYLRSSVLNGQIVAEIASNGDWHRGFVYLGADLLAVQSAGVYWVHQDPVVKSKRITNSSGTIVSTIELDPWGGETNRSSNEAFQPQKFNTYHRDGIGSDDAMNRRYNRWWTRFEQPDPFDGSYDLKDPQSFNRYAYAQDDPITSTDPTGLMPMMCGLYMQYMNGDPIGYGFVCFGPNIPFDPFEPKPGGGGPGPTPQPNTPQQTPQQQQKCNDLSNRIKELRDELSKRTDELIEDKHNLPQTGRNSIDGHQQQFRNKQSELRDKLNQFQSNGCGGGTPADAWKFATMPAPKPAPKKPNPIPIIITPGPKQIPVTPVVVPPVRPSVPFFVPLPVIIIRCIVFRDCPGSGPRQT